MARRTKIRSRWRRWSIRLAFGVLAAVTVSFLMVLPLRWTDPVTSSFMLQDDSGRDPLLHAWVSWEQLGSQHDGLLALTRGESRDGNRGVKRPLPQPNDIGMIWHPAELLSSSGRFTRRYRAHRLSRQPRPRRPRSAITKHHLRVEYR